ncbi:putative alcohol dehydrogenase [Pseudomonas amygdali pv. tabaci]|uniref:Alcohol dehydrogenase n=2 Tax=Pseudomonas amygdali TaxID=47877 RepID=A0A0Q0C0E3_PSEAJ|nr:Alcohol dehydrogenase [Pseudomonas amygdali pv. lachrymans]KPY79781.1 Alcohol dehydrogenase [Pseudomonas amygdali pv. tabaci]RMR79674.1 putative alcohol dehydrogenase [Pseudomonas amygdali pv. tabaci]RMV91233.1 alcohol dehydrogenase [Pseudomonas amygdali pv. tabaci]
MNRCRCRQRTYRGHWCDHGEALSDYLSLILKNVTIRGIANGSRAMFVDLIRAIEANGIETVVARTFKFADAPQAYAYFAAAKHIGKVLIEFERN